MTIPRVLKAAIWRIESYYKHLSYLVDNDIPAPGTPGNAADDIDPNSNSNVDLNNDGEYSRRC
jgi:hypothetical protein